MCHRAVSRVQLGNSVFLSSGDRDLGLPIKVQQESQASSGVEAWNSAFLSSCTTIRVPEELWTVVLDVVQEAVIKIITKKKKCKKAK